MSKKNENIEVVDFNQEIIDAYAVYAKVEVGRKIPHVADGLKLVQRRILYAMYNDLHLYPNTRHRKSARVVGEVLGKYHPHGDQSVYNAMVRMAQPFTYNEPLVDGNGNFGSIDGDPPAAQRYTEARLSQYSYDYLFPLKDYVDTVTTYDGERQEPVYLASLEPTIFINGASGVGAGFTYFIPPHDRKSILKATKAMIDGKNPLKYLKLSFPTDKTATFELEGDIYHWDKEKGSNGSFIYKATIETDRNKVIIKGIPLGVTKVTIIKQILTKLSGYISDADDESKGNNVEIILIPKRGTPPEKLKRLLYEKTSLSKRYTVKLMWWYEKMVFVGSADVMFQHWFETLVKTYKRKLESESISLMKQQKKVNVILKIAKNPKLLTEYVQGNDKHFDDAEIEILRGTSLGVLREAVKNPDKWTEQKQNIENRLEEIAMITSSRENLISDLRKVFKI